MQIFLDPKIRFRGPQFDSALHCTMAPNQTSRWKEPDVSLAVCSENCTCPYWFMSLFCVSCSAATVAVAVAVAVAAAAATAAAAAAAAGCVKSPDGRVWEAMPIPPGGGLGPPE